MPELLELVDRHADVADAVGKRLVVGVWHAQELDAALAERAHRPDDVLGAQGDVLRSGVEVVVEELLDLALLLAGRRLVDRELDPPVPVRHDLAHQRRIVGVDHLVVVVDELGEAEDVPVVVDEAVHVAEPDVADAVIDLEQALAGRGRRRLRDPVIARRERAVVVGAVDEGVNHLAVRSNRRPAQDALLPLQLGGLEGADARRVRSSRARPTRRRRPRRRCPSPRRRAWRRAPRSRHPASAAR